MHSWHKIEYLGLENRLKAMRLIPHFFCPVSHSRWPRKVDTTPFLQNLRDITDAVNLRDTHPGVRFNSQVWNEGAPNRLFVAFVNGHISSFAEKDNKSSPSSSRKRTRKTQLLSSWSSLAAVTGLYLHTVVKLSNMKDPIDPRLIRLIVLKLKREIDQDLDEMKGHCGQASQDLWFWKAFTAALALAHNQRDFRDQETAWLDTSRTDGRSLSSILGWMENKIRAWGEVSGIGCWRDVKEVLRRIVWPNAWPADDEKFAEAFWYRASGGRTPPAPSCTST
jgi:hypothetical protein